MNDKSEVTTTATVPTAAPKRPCRKPGCPALVSSGYCAAHAMAVPTARSIYDSTKRKDNPALALAARIRNGTQWQKVRAIHARTEPLCRDPFGDHSGYPAPRAHGHHVLPLATHPHLAYDLGNLASLCVACHRKVEAMERAGQPTQALFA